MTDKPFKELKVGGKLDAAAPWMMAVGTLLAVAGFVLTFTLGAARQRRGCERAAGYRGNRGGQ